MAPYWKTKHCLCLCVSLCYISSAFSMVTPNIKIKAVNLGGWLVTEGGIKPSLFYDIPHNDSLDGTQLQLKSVTVGKYLSAEGGGGTIIVANRTSASGGEKFRLWRINETTFQFRLSNNRFMGLDAAGNGIDIVAVAKTPGGLETFQIVRNPSNSTRVRIKAPNGFFLQVKKEELVTADSQGNGNWGNDDPSVFVIYNIVVSFRGEYQVTNGYGPIRAAQVMKEHWSTYIVENDFKFISSNGLNAVRIPVGWWIASDPTPPLPYVGGSLQALDNAFLWAQKYGVKAIIDLHAAPGSQNPWEHSSTRDGSQEWGLSDIQQTVDVIDFLTARYASNPSLYAVELINEPLSPGVSLDVLTKYYRAGYNTVRKHSSSAYVVMSNRLGRDINQTELFPFASGLTGSVIDVHYYNLFLDTFDNLTVQQNIDFVYANRSAQLNQITTANGPLTFVGEWVAEWQRSHEAGKLDYQNFAKAQLEVYGRASFGWAYWTLKNVNNHWSLEWMINNGYITLIEKNETMVTSHSEYSSRVVNLTFLLICFGSIQFAMQMANSPSTH